MPKVSIPGRGVFEVATGTRLVRAIADRGIDIGHRCGGWARCTTCRVEILAGAPAKMTVAEREKRAEAGLTGDLRLACQILVEGDMEARPLMLVSEQGWTDPGPQPEATITPEPEWS